MNSSHEPKRRTYTQDELAGLFATYFGDKLTQSQLESLLTTVAEAHANHRARAAESATQPSPVVSNRPAGSHLIDQGSIARFFGGWASA